MTVSTTTGMQIIGKATELAMMAFEEADLDPSGYVANHLTLAKRAFRCLDNAGTPREVETFYQTSEAALRGLELCGYFIRNQ